MKCKAEHLTWVITSEGDFSPSCIWDLFEYKASFSLPRILSLKFTPPRYMRGQQIQSLFQCGGNSTALPTICILDSSANCSNLLAGEAVSYFLHLSCTENRPLGIAGYVTLLETPKTAEQQMKYKFGMKNNFYNGTILRCLRLNPYSVLLYEYLALRYDRFHYSKVKGNHIGQSRG